MHNITKKWIIAGAAAVITLGMLTACMKVTEKKDDAAVVEAEDLPVPETLNDGKEKKAGDAQNVNPEGGDDTQNVSQGTGDDTPEEGNKPHYINEGKELYGDIWEVGEGRFTVTQVYTGESEDGGQEMAMLAEDAAAEAPKITIVYDEKTKFIKQNIWDGGARHEEKETTAADLKKGLTAQMNGSYEGDVFHATEIMIVEVIWD